MKRLLKTLCLTLSIVMAFAAVTACGNKSVPIVYSGKTLATGNVGEAYNETVAFATGPDKIYYELAMGEWLPEGLDLSENGIITGTPSEATDNYDFNVVASADNADTDVSAKFSITIKQGSVEIESRELKEGAKNSIYIDTLFSLEKANKNLSYKLKTGETLPVGLKITADGYLLGMPLEVATNKPFKVEISGKGYETVVIDYVVNIASGADIVIGDTITYVGSELPAATVGEVYIGGNVALATGASGISYKRAYIGGIGFPTGIKFDESGLVYGIAEDSTNGTLSFNVTASATDYSDARVKFSIDVLDKEVETTKFEAELTNLSGKQGAGYSSSPSGKGIIQRASTASNGAAVSYLHTEISIDFKIFASENASNLKLDFAFASDFGAVTFSPNELAITVNGTKINYSAFSITGGQQAIGAFQTKTITSALALVKGENIIVVSVLANTLRNGAVGGPTIDFMQIQNASVKTSYRPKVSNLL